MKRISLTQGQFALIDDSDFESLNRFKWQALKVKNTFYAARTCSCIFGGKRHTIRMHRQLMSTPFGTETDHRDHNGLNNQRSNLRICTRSQNQHNYQHDPKKKFSSRFKGVGWYKKYKKWQARICQNDKLIYLGYFDNEIEAAKAYDRKAIELFGDFAYLNFERKKAG